MVLLADLLSGLSHPRSQYVQLNYKRVYESDVGYVCINLLISMGKGMFITNSISEG